MKNYFKMNCKGGFHIIRFDIVGFVTKSYCNVNVYFNGTLSRVELHHEEADKFVKEYEKWLDLQYKKDLAIANQSEKLTGSEKPDHIEDKLGMVLTKEQIQSIARELLSERSCIFCKLRYKRCDVCYEEFVPTDEFVEKINKLLEEK